MDTNRSPLKVQQDTIKKLSFGQVMLLRGPNPMTKLDGKIDHFCLTLLTNTFSGRRSRPLNKTKSHTSRHEEASQEEKQGSIGVVICIGK